MPNQVRSWNLRKCSAAALDMLSNNYEDQDLLPLMLPIVQQNLDQQQDWRLRESAILALGAVSEGCHMGMSSYIEGEALWGRLGLLGCHKHAGL
jgi:transportin-1